MTANKRELTVKQNRFCMEMAYHGNASAAYRNSYDCSGMNKRSIEKEADNLKKNPRIATKIAELREEYERRFNADKDKAVKVLSKIIGFDISDLYVYDEEKQECRIRKPEELPTATKAVIQQIEEKDGCIKYKLYNKIEAIRQLSVLLGWESEKKVEVSTDRKNVLRIGFED